MNVEHEFLFWTKEYAFDLYREKQREERLCEHARHLARTRRISLDEATEIAIHELGYPEPKEPDVGPGDVLADLADMLSEEALPLDEAVLKVYDNHPELVELNELWQKQHGLIRHALRRLAGAPRFREADTADALARVVLEEVERIRAYEEVAA